MPTPHLIQKLPNNHGYCNIVPEEKEWGIFVITGTEPSYCPTCAHELSGYDRRKRGLRRQDGSRIKLLIRRLYCRRCKKHHAELPDIVVPYKRYDRESIEAVVDGKPTNAPQEERTRQKIRRWYKSILRYLLGVWRRCEKKRLVSRRKEVTFQEVVMVTVNSGLWSTHPNGRVQAKKKSVPSSEKQKEEEITYESRPKPRRHRSGALRSTQSIAAKGNGSSEACPIATTNRKRK